MTMVLNHQSPIHADPGRYWAGRAPADGCAPQSRPVVFLRESEAKCQEALRRTFRDNNYQVESFVDCASFEAAHPARCRGCVFIDVTGPQTAGLDLIKELRSRPRGLAVIAIIANVDTARVVEAMKAGASDCIQLPADADALIRALERSMLEADTVPNPAAFRSLAKQRVASLTARQREVLDLITTGHPSKNIALDLNISQRTVENHRAAIARKTGSRSLSDVVHTAVCANCALVKAAQNS